VSATMGPSIEVDTTLLRDLKVEAAWSLPSRSFPLIKNLIPIKYN
jgi:hypothetical protein